MKEFNISDISSIEGLTLVSPDFLFCGKVAFESHLVALNTKFKLEISLGENLILFLHTGLMILLKCFKTVLILGY